MGFFGKKKEKEIETVSSEEAMIKKRILDILKKKDTEITVLAPLSSRFIISNKSISINLLIDGDAEVIKVRVASDTVSINSFIDVKSKSSIHKLRGEFIDQIIKVILVWIEKDRSKLEKSLFDEIHVLEYIDELIQTLPDVEEDTENKKSLK